MADFSALNCPLLAQKRVKWLNGFKTVLNTNRCLKIGRTRLNTSIYIDIWSISFFALRLPNWFSFMIAKILSQLWFTLWGWARVGARGTRVVLSSSKESIKWLTWVEIWKSFLLSNDHNCEKNIPNIHFFNHALRPNSNMSVRKKYNTPFYAIFSPLALWAIASTQILKLIIWIPLFLGHFVDSILSTRIYTISRFSVPQEICSHIFIILGLHFTTLYSVLLCVEVIALSPYLQNLFLHIPIPCPKYESISNISCKMCVYQNNNTKKIYFLCWKLFKWPFNNVFQTIWWCCAPSCWWFA